MASGKGAKITLGECKGQPHAILFGEDQARYVIAVPADLADFIRANAEGATVPFRTLGTVGGNALVIDDLLNVSRDNLSKAHEEWFPRFMA